MPAFERALSAGSAAMPTAWLKRSEVATAPRTDQCAHLASVRQVDCAITVSRRSPTRQGVANLMPLLGDALGGLVCRQALSAGELYSSEGIDRLPEAVYAIDQGDQ